MKIRTNTSRWRATDLLILPAGIFMLGLAIGATPGSAQVVETPQGMVEFVGLEQWSVSQVMDSIAVRTPDARPAQYAMALRELGFARAQATPLLEVQPDPVTLITVVEPHRTEMVRLRSGLDTTRELPPRWAGLAGVLREEGVSFQSAVNLRWLRDGQGNLPAAIAQGISAPGRIDAIERVWAALDALDTAGDLSDALAALQNDAGTEHRVLAAAVASGFPDDERAWRALLEALLDPSARVTATAGQALGSMVAMRPIPIDWSDAAPSVRALLAGANLPAFPLVLQVLVSTDLSPAIAPELLRDSGVLLLGHLGSRFSPHRELAHEVLVRLRGLDLGDEAGAWELWIEGI